MTAQPVLEPLTAAGLTVAVRLDGVLVVWPAQRITPLLDAHIRAHRAELFRALSHVPQRRATPLVDDRPIVQGAHGLPPGWMAEDDARRAATMAAGKRRLAARR